MASNTDIAIHSLVITLKSIAQKTSLKISSITDISVCIINLIYTRAMEWGFDSNIQSIIIKNIYLKNASHSDRPFKQTFKIQQQVIFKVQTDHYSCEKTCADIVSELSQEGFNISAQTILRILRITGFQKTKSTWKSGLFKRIKEKWLQFCLAYKDWTFEDWKLIIWSDETFVILLYWCGGY